MEGKGVCSHRSCANVKCSNTLEVLGKCNKRWSILGQILYERHIRKPVHEPANVVTIHNKATLQSLREGTGMARSLPYITLRVCVVAKLLPKEAQFERGPEKGPTMEIQKEEKR